MNAITTKYYLLDGGCIAVVRHLPAPYKSHYRIHALDRQLTWAHRSGVHLDYSDVVRCGSEVLPHHLTQVGGRDIIRYLATSGEDAEVHIDKVLRGHVDGGIPGNREVYTVDMLSMDKVDQRLPVSETNWYGIDTIAFSNDTFTEFVFKCLHDRKMVGKLIYTSEEVYKEYTEYLDNWALNNHRASERR